MGTSAYVPYSCGAASPVAIVQSMPRKRARNRLRQYAIPFVEINQVVVHVKATDYAAAVRKAESVWRSHMRDGEREEVAYAGNTLIRPAETVWSNEWGTCIVTRDKR